MPSPPDRNPHILEQSFPIYPHPPLNVFCQSGFIKGTYDVRWSLPSELNSNTKFNIVGVNIYRSFDSEFGRYFRINSIPLGGNYYRDKTQVQVALQEDVSDRFVRRGDTDPAGLWVFEVRNKPIVLNGPLGEADCTSLNVQVTINEVPASILYIDGVAGQVTLRGYPDFDVTSQTQIPAVLPTNLGSDVVLATYRFLANEVQDDLDKKIFYRLTTVAFNESDQSLVETPLDRAALCHNKEVEKLDYIWREAIRRNRFLLTQGGERVKIFIRKTQGPKCQCKSSAHKQSKSDCLSCYGTGILGGYEGPYDSMIAPDDGEKHISQSNRGRTFSHIYDTWTGPSPLLSQRDFIVKLNGDRYGIGAVRAPSNRGMILQQFFSISHLDDADIRYKVPVIDPRELRYPETRNLIPGKGSSLPEITERSTIPDEREFRGTTVTTENINRR